MACSFCGIDHPASSTKDVFPPCVMSGPPARPYKCPACKKAYPLWAKLNRHLNRQNHWAFMQVGT